MGIDLSKFLNLKFIKFIKYFFFLNSHESKDPSILLIQSMTIEPIEFPLIKIYK